MNKWLKRILATLAVLAVIGAGAYYWLVMESGGTSATYAIDMARVRQLADAMPGPKPGEIRVERVESGAFPATAVVAGDGWSRTPMTMFSYQLVYPGSTLIIDTAMPAKGAESMGGRFDADSYARMSKALGEAAQITITHEHGDHIGGFLAQPNEKALLEKARFSKEQVGSAARYNDGMKADAFTGYQPIAYDKYLALAPGVVLIRAAGHTPGSQMVYVKTESGAEFIFTGDVAWHMRNIELVRERARLVSMFMLREDRDAVLAQLAALNALQKAEPNLHIVPGHDPEPVDALERAGLLKAKFR